MNKSKAVILIAAAAFLGYVGYSRLSLPLDTVGFNPDSLYRGTSEAKTIDPREYYHALNGLTMSDSEEDGCIISVVSESKAIKVKTVDGNYLPTIYKGKETDYVKVIGTEGDKLFTDKQEIVMPVSNTKFKNSNLKDSTLSDTNGIHNIEIVKGDKILIVFEDVMTWWCHAHDPSSNVQHDTKIGYGSSIESIRGGAVLGVAKSSTKVKVYQIRDDVYSEKHKVEDVENMSELQQLDAGEYLINGKVKLL